MTLNPSLKDRYLSVITELKNFPSTKLIAVSKTKPFSDIETLYELGQRDFGENYIQEFGEKKRIAEQKGMNDIIWHLIGPQQSNKASQITKLNPVFHALDSIDLARRIDSKAKQLNSIISCFLQVNISSEGTKHGIPTSETPGILESLKKLDNLKILGLMCIPNPKDPSQLAFQSLKELLYSTKELHLGELSMGMSGDYLLAAQHGSTYVRVGSIIFGLRN